jgi:hypothetical protein
MVLGRFVRPGMHRLITSASAYFGSGCVVFRVRYRGGAAVVPGTARLARDNGFASWGSSLVYLPAGSSVEIEEWWYPGGGHSRTHTADLKKWRVERRAHLMTLFCARRAGRECQERRAARLADIEARLRSAIARHDGLMSEASMTASGRSGGRARRRAIALRREAADQQRLATALASHWVCEASGINPGHGDLDSRTVRWELDGRQSWWRGLPYWAHAVRVWL